MIKPEYANLQKLFADRVFRIPPYQRFYSWRKKQREDLFSDLLKLADRGNDNHHFMATIVCHRAGSEAVGGSAYEVHEVVDGQQRLTTLVLLLKAIQIKLGDESRDSQELLELLVKRDSNLIILQSNNTNEHILTSYLRDSKIPGDDDISTHADKSLSDAINQCTGFVDDWIDKRGDVLSLLRLVKSKLGFIVYDTDDESIVYDLFEVLNSRGLAVDWLDKTKTVLMGRAFDLHKTRGSRDTAIETLQSIWTNIYKEAAKVSISGEEILRVAATLYYSNSDKGKPQSSSDSLDLLKEKCDRKDRPRQVSEKLLDVSRKLVSIEQNIFYGPVTKILQARVLAVAILSASCLNDKQRLKAMNQWERVTFRIFELYGKDSRNKVGDYIRLAYKIINGNDEITSYAKIMEKLRALGKEFPIEKAAAEGLSGKAAYDNSPAGCRYILWRYEEHLADKAGRGSTVDEQVRRDIWKMRASDSIEHIFPQNPEVEGPWKDQMCKPGEKVEPHTDHVDRIGNLILLPMTLNNEARVKGFSDKKEVYSRHNLRMVQEVTAETDWTLAQIEDRETKIIEWAKTAWGDLQD